MPRLGVLKKILFVKAGTHGNFSVCQASAPDTSIMTVLKSTQHMTISIPIYPLQSYLFYASSRTDPRAGHRDGTLSVCKKVVETIGKTPIEVKDLPILPST